MKEYITKEVIKTVEITKGYTSTCNKCGKSDTIIEEKNNEWESDIKEFYLNFGYESSFDGEEWEFDLCEKCILNIIKEFKHVPKGFRKNRYIEFKSGDHQKLFDYWKKNNDWDELRFKSYEEIVELNDGWTCTKEYLNEAIKKYHPNKPLLEEVN